MSCLKIQWESLVCFFVFHYTASSFFFHPVGATGAFTATTAGRQNIFSRRWRPPIRRPSSLTWRAQTASCLCPSQTGPRRLRRRVWSKNRAALWLLLSSSCWKHSCPCILKAWAHILDFTEWYETTNASAVLNMVIKMLVITVRCAAGGWINRHH